MRATQLARWRWLAIVAVLAIVAAACQQGGGGTTAAPSDGGTATTSLSGDGGATTTAAGEEEPTTGGDLATYRMGIFSDTTTDNFWAYYDPASSVWTGYILNDTKSALYGINYPGIELDTDLAASSEVPTGAAEGDGWAIEVEMRDDATWSDGTPVTANDVAFTFATVRDLALGGNWLSAWPLPDPENPAAIGLTEVTAVDDYTVKLVFNAQPGLVIWPHSVGTAPVMPAHTWGPIVEEAKASDDPAAALYAASGVENDVASGPMNFVEREEGAFARSEANEVFYDRGVEVESGGFNYVVGPYINESTFSVYGGQDAAVLALKAGEVDYLLNPLGMQRGLLAQVQDDPNLTAVVNPTFGFRYLAFNMREEPMSIPAFRDALALMIDKEFMANNVLQGAAFPLYATMPEGNRKWYNAEVAESFASNYVGKTIQERLEGAVQILRDAGFTWETEPAVATDAEGNVLNAVNNGVGIMYNGTPVRPLEILAPGPGYDPLRATYSIWIETWLNQLGFEAEANPTDFNALVAAVDPQADNTAAFDMFILGWSLGNPAFPDYHHSFFHSSNDMLVNGGSNRGGYASEEFDALADAYQAAQSEEEAFDLMWQMEEVLQRDKPYILLFDTGILEFYRTESIEYPFSETLGGIQFIQGMQELVTAAK
ncbi:MAG TPA: ABC transporter substrate-binding protein [Acidimicrobiia bacterium]